jgi:hypothetical protein
MVAARTPMLGSWSVPVGAREIGERERCRDQRGNDGASATITICDLLSGLKGPRADQMKVRSWVSVRRCPSLRYGRRGHPCSARLGLGTRSDLGGTVCDVIHGDGFVLRPALEVDGVMRIEDGHLMVPLG